MFLFCYCYNCTCTLPLKCVAISSARMSWCATHKHICTEVYIGVYVNVCCNCQAAPNVDSLKCVLCNGLLTVSLCLLTATFRRVVVFFIFQDGFVFFWFFCALLLALRNCLQRTFSANSWSFSYKIRSNLPHVDVPHNCVCIVKCNMLFVSVVVTWVDGVNLTACYRRLQQNNKATNTHTHNTYESNESWWSVFMVVYENCQLISYISVCSQFGYYRILAPLSWYHKYPLAHIPFSCCKIWYFSIFFILFWFFLLACLAA